MSGPCLAWLLGWGALLELKESIFDQDWAASGALMEHLAGALWWGMSATTKAIVLQDWPVSGPNPLSTPMGDGTFGWGARVGNFRSSPHQTSPPELVTGTTQLPTRTATPLSFYVKAIPPELPTRAPRPLHRDPVRFVVHVCEGPARCSGEEFPILCHRPNFKRSSS